MAGKLPATHYIVIYMLQLHQAKGSLQLVHLGVDARPNHRDLIGKPEVLQEVNTLLRLLIMTDNGPALNGAETLGGMKAQYREVAAVEYGDPVLLHPEGMGSVIDHLKTVGVGNLLYRVGVTRIAVHMNSHDGRGVGRDCRLDAGRVNGEPFGLDINEHRPDVVPPQRMGCCHEAEGGGDDLAGDLQGLQGRHQRQGAVGKEREILHPEVISQLFLKLLMERPVVGENPALPYLMEVYGKLLQRRHGGLGYVYGVF